MRNVCVGLTSLQASSCFCVHCSHLLAETNCVKSSPHTRPVQRAKSFKVSPKHMYFYFIPTSFFYRFKTYFVPCLLSCSVQYLDGIINVGSLDRNMYSQRKVYSEWGPDTTDTVIYPKTSFFFLIHSCCKSWWQHAISQKPSSFPPYSIVRLLFEINSSQVSVRPFTVPFFKHMNATWLELAPVLFHWNHTGAGVHHSIGSEGLRI